MTIRYATLFASCLMMLSWGHAQAEQPAISTNPPVWITGIPYRYNDEGYVPAGLFGTHNVPLTETIIDEWGIELDRFIQRQPQGQPALPGGEYWYRTFPSNLNMIIECLWDRYQPAVSLEHPRDWQERLTSLAHAYATNSAAAGFSPILQFWNEPFLNWATQPGVNYDGRWFDASRAVTNGPVHDRITGEPIEHLTWTRRTVAVRTSGPGKGTVDYVATRYLPREKRPGDTIKRNNLQFDVQEHWWAQDTSQNSYWSGEFNSRLYRKMFSVFATALKEKNPDVSILGGWGFNMWSGNWDAWDTLYKPLIDDCHELLDGIHEHHYGADTRMVLVSYEHAYAYTFTRYGKRLKFYNTEAGGQVDPEHPGTIHNSMKGTRAERSLGAFIYTLRDILYMIRWAPDKARSRCAHHAHHNGGEKAAFQLLQPLRGRLIWCETENRNLWPVAAWNENSLYVVVFNDNWYSSETTALHFSPPAGTQFTSIRKISPFLDGDIMRLQHEEPVRVNTEGPLVLPLTLANKQATAYRLELREIAAISNERVIHQYPASELRQNVRKEQPVSFTVVIPREQLNTASHAWLQVMQLNWPSNEIHVAINDVPVNIEFGGFWADRTTIPPSILNVTNNITMQARGEQGAWLPTLSLLIGRDKENCDRTGWREQGDSTVHVPRSTP